MLEEGQGGDGGGQGRGGKDRKGKERTTQVNAAEEAGGRKGSAGAIRLVEVTHSLVFCTGESLHRNARNALLFAMYRSAPCAGITTKASWRCCSRQPSSGRLGQQRGTARVVVVGPSAEPAGCRPWCATACCTVVRPEPWPWPPAPTSGCAFTTPLTAHNATRIMARIWSLRFHMHGWLPSRVHPSMLLKSYPSLSCLTS